MKFWRGVLEYWAWRWLLYCARRTMYAEVDGGVSRHRTDWIFAARRVLDVEKVGLGRGWLLLGEETVTERDLEVERGRYAAKWYPRKDR